MKDIARWFRLMRDGSLKAVRLSIGAQSGPRVLPHLRMLPYDATCADDLTPTDRLSLVAFTARSTVGAVGGSGH